MNTAEIAKFAEIYAVEVGTTIETAATLVKGYVPGLEKISISDATYHLRRMLGERSLPKEPGARMSAIISASTPKSGPYGAYSDGYDASGARAEKVVLDRVKADWDALSKTEQKAWIERTGLPKDTHRFFSVRAAKLLFAESLQKAGAA